MTNFSTNQVMQFYVVDSASDITILPYAHEKAFKISFPKLGITSDKIENIEWAKLTTAAKLQPKAKKATITFKGTTVVPGETYSVKVSYPEIGGAGVESWTTKTAAVVALEGSTKDTVVAELIEQLTKILAVDGVLTVASVTNGLTITPNVANLKYERGIRPIAIPDFNVTVNQVKKSEESKELVDWVVLNEDDKQIPTAAVETGIKSGYKLADMEYFAMGERGDEYRMAAYPNHIVTDYKITPTADYDVYNIHYSYKGYNTQSHKSEKDLIIAVPADVRLTTLASKITELGVSLVTIDVDAA